MQPAIAEAKSALNQEVLKAAHKQSREQAVAKFKT
jgi:hypothetical protein